MRCGVSHTSPKASSCGVDTGLPGEQGSRPGRHSDTFPEALGCVPALWGLCAIWWLRLDIAGTIRAFFSFMELG